MKTYFDEILWLATWHIVLVVKISYKNWMGVSLWIIENFLQGVLSSDKRSTNIRRGCHGDGDEHFSALGHNPQHFITNRLGYKKKHRYGLLGLVPILLRCCQCQLCFRNISNISRILACSVSISWCSVKVDSQLWRLVIVFLVKCNIKSVVIQWRQNHGARGDTSPHFAIVRGHGGHDLQLHFRKSK